MTITKINKTWGFLTEQEEKNFCEGFYDRCDFDDTAAPEPWGCPWYYHCDSSDFFEWLKDNFPDKNLFEMNSAEELGQFFFKFLYETEEEFRELHDNPIGGEDNG